MKRVRYDEISQHESKHWWYRVRRALAQDLLKNEFGARHDLMIADIGAGTGGLAKELERYGTVVGVDIEPLAVEYAKSNGVGDMRTGSAEHTGLPSDTYNAVFCLDVLEHIKDDTAGARELLRILKPGGIAIIFVPTFMFLWSKNDDEAQHLRRYRLSALKKVLKNNGFSLMRASYFNTFLFPLIAVVRIITRVLHIPLKSEVVVPNTFVNETLYQIFNTERLFLPRLSFPFGVSGFAVVRKPPS